MNADNCVLFKGTKDGISIHLDEATDFVKIKERLNQKMDEAAKFFDGVKTNIIFKGKSLTESEEMELLSIISEKTNMNITFIQSVTEDNKPKDIPALLESHLNQHNITKFYKGNIRSGQVLEFQGSIIIIGDVNPGAVVRAEGNIIVLGALKGLAHAGHTGLMDAFVAALSMAPVQLRIGDIITRFPEAGAQKSKKIAEYAYIEDGQIYVVPLE